MGLLELTTYLK